MRPVRLLALALLLLAAPSFAAENQAPLLKDFLGLNGHTVQFKPKLYAPICRLARDYHPINWDLGKDSDFKTIFPFARNKVHWESVYGSWQAEGWEINCSLMLNGFKPGDWKDMARDAETYGKAFAKHFGPSSEKKLVASAEIGNEPGDYPDEDYRKIFEAMAKGLRAGDPKLQIVTCAAVPGKSHKYAKSLECVKGLEHLYDVINMHDYAQVKGWPTWERSYPEDPNIAYVKDVKDVIAWRDAHAKGKPIWITEYGWDCSTKPNEEEGTFKEWKGVTDVDQAQYLVRSTLLFMRLGVDRAYIYWFNDSDKPSVHAAAGLTRNWKPKPSYYAVAHLYKTLGAYRLEAPLLEAEGAVNAYLFRHGTDARQRVLALWSPTGDGRSTTAVLDAKAGTLSWTGGDGAAKSEKLAGWPAGAKVLKAERMPLKEGEAPPVGLTTLDGKTLLPVDQHVLYVWVE